MKNTSLWTLLAAALVATVVSCSVAPSSGHAASPLIDGVEPGQWTQDVDAAKAYAAEKELPLLYNFTGSDWCGWCKLMDRQVFSKEEWSGWAKDNIVLVWIDFPRDKSLVPEKYTARNEKISREFGVQGFPTYFVLDSNGETVIGRAGASQDASPEKFIKEIENILRNSDKAIAAYRESLSDEMKTQLDAAKAARDAAHKKLEDWVATGPERTPENTELFQAMLKEIETADAAWNKLLSR